MLETPHVVLGATIAAKVGNPLLAIPLAFASHFLLDVTPHWNPHLNREIKKYGYPTKQSVTIVFIDVIVSLALGLVIANHSLPDQTKAFWVLMGAFAAVLPDIVEGPYFFMGVKNDLIMKWLKFQKSIQNDTSIVPGILSQVVVIAACLWWVFG